MDTRVMLLGLLVSVASYASLMSADIKVKHPVILIPGDGASQLAARLNKTSSKYSYCPKNTSSYEIMWLSFAYLLPLKINCLVEDLTLRYDPTTHKTYNAPGVDMTTPDFGNTSTVEYLSTNKKFFRAHYFHAIVKDLVSIGYSRGLSVRAAPYDFRKAPNEMGDYFVHLKDLIEDTYIRNNNTKVVMIAHSMGNPVFLYFLNHQIQSWKDKFIQSHISLAGVWGGAVKAVRLMTSGFNFDVPLIKSTTIRKVQRSMPSTAFLMPSDQFWNSAEVLISTPEKNYTVANYKELFQDMNFTDGYNMRKDTENLIRTLIPPGVSLHCIHGSNVRTAVALDFKKGGFPDKTPKDIFGDGDGTVNMRSLLGCQRWKGQQKFPVFHTVYEGKKSSHIAILVNPDVRKYILDVVTGKR